MKILVCHNYYRTSAPSGEDAVADNEVAMLREFGHDVSTFNRFNDELDDSTLRKRVSIAKNTIWSSSIYKDLRRTLEQRNPDIVHFHNIFPQLSPSAYKACYDSNIPSIHTLHNFRQFCPGALLQRNGRVCELCLHGSLLNSLRHRCYRDSLLATGTIASTIYFNRMIGSYTKYVGQYIALTQFSASRMTLGGIPESMISIKPNFLPVSPTPGSGSGDYAVYVGRLSEEKGVKTLIHAWKDIDLTLKVVGDGPLRDELRSLTEKGLKNIEFCGFLDRHEIIEIVRDAVFQIVPSEWYEGFPMVVLEAFACGTPVIASNIGSLGEIIVENKTGRKFEVGNVNALRSAVGSLLSDRSALSRMRKATRDTFDKYYSKSTNYNTLMKIYNSILDRHRSNNEG